MVRAVVGRTVLLDLDDCDASSTGDNGMGGSMNAATEGGSPVDGLGWADESLDLNEPVGVYDDEGCSDPSEARDRSDPYSKENPDRASCCSSRLGRADAIGDGTASSLLFFPSNGGVPGNIGSCHSKWGCARLLKTPKLRSDTFRPRGKLYVA